MPIYEFQCCHCKQKFESIEKIDTEYVTCECGYIANKVFSADGQKFNLTYNPKSDICDWDGNTTRYYDEYKKMKAEGKKPRIPALDGDG